MSNRPSRKEKINKIRDALEAVQNGSCTMPLTKHITEDAAELGVDTQEEYWRVIERALEEIQVIGPEKTYAGRHPPEKSYEDGLQGAELWAYCWDSKSCGKKMYLKFVMRGKRYIHIDCHENKTKI